MASYFFYLLVSVFLLLNVHVHRAISESTKINDDPTQGFLNIPLNSSNFVIQSPYDLSVSDRYSFVDGIHKMWVLSSDKPHSPLSRTSPRTEIRIHGYDYNWGVWQFEGHAYVPRGTSGVSIMQVFGATSRHTTLMLHVYNGALMYYNSKLIDDEIYDKWFQVNAIHDVNASVVSVYIDRKLKLNVLDHGGVFHYFKCGVYAQNYSSYFMESKWKGIKLMKKAT
ncbi:Concanavalin A-like lectins/glucanases protein [Dioscorea alata]|uniref:Concanavalin A-like lectins/glucanases protein n=1 Tax=Dioscorea alata TaxID=55571 RepID=A0ACB7VCB8_DIOAL|nr:Concanavalin A-like lectins/glucanases protein [Dioscorea alata]